MTAPDNIAVSSNTGFWAVPALFGVSLLAKFLWVSSQTDTLYLSPSWLAGSVACLLLALAPLHLVNSRGQILLAIGISLAVDLVFLCDLTYFRYFEDIPSAAQLGQAGLLVDVWTSVLALLRPTDLLLVIDIPLYLLVFKREPSDADLRRRAKCVVLLLLMGLVGLKLSKHLETPLQKSVAAEHFKNYALGREFGLLNYHLSDLRGQFSLRLSRSKKPSNLEPFLGPPERAVDSMAVASPYRGQGKGMNVLVIVLETWQGFGLNMVVDGQPVMPFMSQLKDRSLYFRNVYDQTNHASSADGELILSNSLHPYASGASAFLFQGNTYYSVPTILRKAGYDTCYFGYYDGGFWNARVMNQKYGMEHLFFANFGPPPTPEERVGWGLADYPLLVRVQAELEKQKSPFYATVQASMGHHPFRELKKEQQWLKLSPELDGTLLGDFLQICRFRDRNLEMFVKRFEQSELAKNTILVFTGDHASGMTPQELAPLYRGSNLPDRAEWAKRQTVSLLIYYPGVKPLTITKPVGQMDFAPTLLHLLGVTPDRPIFLGQNMLARQGPVYFRKAACAIDGNILISVLDSKAYDLETNQAVSFEPWAGVARQAVAEWKLSDQILRYNLIPDLRTLWGKQSGGHPRS